MNKYQRAQKDKKEIRKAEKRMERHKVNLELKKILDAKKDLEEIEDEVSTLTVYQNKNGSGWVKVEIPYKKQKI